MATANPLAGATGCGQPARGCRPPLGRKGRLPAAYLQVGGRQRPARKGQPCHQQGRRRRSQGLPPLGREVAGHKGQPPPTQGQRRRSCRMVMRRSDRTDDDEVNNHRAWRYADAHVDPIMSD
ncbi:hypothetical protein GW17_00041492 [Ensete ventricosum]|nr:hypothetical protein GW17_00041492 [Ensete ventricosum]